MITATPGNRLIRDIVAAVGVEMSSAARPDVPLYQQLQRYRPTVGVTTYGLTIAIEEEPTFRQFVTQLAELCGRPVVLLTGP